jgi:hypothetical protein
MVQPNVASLVARISVPLVLLACASAPPQGAGSASGTAAVAPAGEESASNTGSGKSQPPRRLDRTMPDIRLSGPMPSSTDRAKQFLQITVTINPDGRPDINTLRINGPGAVENRDVITSWIVGGLYTPGKDGLGRPIAAPYKVRVTLGGS